MSLIGHRFLINVIQKNKTTDKNQHLMQNINNVGCLCEMIQSKEKLKAVENHQKYFYNSKKKLGLDPDIDSCDEQDVISALQVAFEGEIILTQHCIKNKELMLIFLNTNLEQKLMNIIMKLEILNTNKVGNL